MWEVLVEAAKRAVDNLLAISMEDAGRMVSGCRGAAMCARSLAPATR